MISNQVIDAAREAMRAQTKANNAPAWPLTEIAVAKGRELAKQHNVDENLVVASLYLAHTVFSDEIRGDIQQRHWALSGDFAKQFLAGQGVDQADTATIVNAIRAHHDDEPANTKVAEVVKNAEGYKFVSLEGALIYLHDLGRRGLPVEQAAQSVLYKLDQKLSYLTLPECKKEGAEQAKTIRGLMQGILDAQT